MSQRPTAVRITAHAIEYAGLVVLVGGSFLVIVLGGGALLGVDPPHAGLTLAAAVLLGATFEPARHRLRALANRLVYGHRSSPWEAVRQLATQMGNDRDAVGLLRELAGVIRAGTGAAEVVVWLRLDATWLPAAGSPDREPAGDPAASEPAAGPAADLPRPPGVGLAVPIRTGGELLGAITVSKPGGGPLLPLEQQLVTDIASHAGIVTRTLQLRESRRHRLELSRRTQRELVAARVRLVAAYDAERRRLERDIHDGCQQPAVVLAGRLGLAGALAGRDPGQARALLAAAGEDVERLASALRRLVRSAPVPELAAGGIAAALRAQTGDLAGVEIDDQTSGRHPIELATTVYYCCLEAIQNAARHAGASRIQVRLGEPERCLRASVRDDGTGFDPGRDHPGTGLRNLRERLRPWGGRVTVDSSPDGTEVRIEIPLPAVRPVPVGATAGEVAAA